MDFKKVLSVALRFDPSLKIELADKMGVAPSTVDRWASGTARPDPILQEEILNFIRNRKL